MVVAMCTNFSHFLQQCITSRSPTDQVVNNQVFHHLDSEVDCIRQAEQWMVVVGKGLMKENLSGRLRVEPDQVMGYSELKLTKMKANSRHKSLFNTTKLYSQFLFGKVSIYIPDC